MATLGLATCLQVFMAINFTAICTEFENLMISAGLFLSMELNSIHANKSSLKFKMFSALESSILDLIFFIGCISRHQIADMA